MKPSISHFITGLLIGIFVACVCFAWIGQRQGSGNSASSARILTVAHNLPIDHPIHQGLVDFADFLEETSGGKMKARIYPSEQLGTEVECIEKVQQGSIDFVKTSASPVGSFVSVYKLFSLPYLFRDKEHFWKVLDGELGQELLDVIEKTDSGSNSGLVGLAYYDAGSRSFYTRQPVKSPSDLQGLKIRVQPDPVSEDMVKSMGASAAAISFGELYTSLKQGGVDGAENNPPSFYSSRHFEVCKYFVLDRHSRVPDMLVASSKLWNSLDETERSWVREAAVRSSHSQRELWAKETEDCIKQLKENGVTIIEPEVELFRNAAASVTKKYATGKRAHFVKRISEVE